MAKYKKRTSKGAIFAVVISLLCAAAIVLGILTNWYKDFSRFKPKGSNTVTANADTLYAPEEGLLISPETSNGIMLYSAATPLSAFATYSLDENVTAVKTITAHFTPADTTLQKVDYTAAWKNAASTWATDKDVSDYITLTQSADGSLDCAVSLLDAIGEQIIITCTARPLDVGDWTPSATCTVDYYKRAVGLKTLKYYAEYDIWEEDGEHIEHTYVTDINFLNGTHTIRFENEAITTNSGSGYYTAGFEYGTGTKDGGTYGNLKFKLNADMVSTIQSITGKAPETIEIDNVNWEQAITQILGSSAVNDSAKRAQLYNAFVEKYNAGQNVFSLVVNYKNAAIGELHEYEVGLKFNPVAFGVRATSVGLDKPGITF